MRGVNVAIFALPIAVPIGFGKQWIEGLASDPGVQDQIEQEYGVEYKNWLRALVSALDNQNDIAAVYQRVKAANAVTEHLGNRIEEAQLHLGEPIVSITFLTKTLHATEYEERRQFLGPYKTAAIAPASAAAGGGTLTQTAVDKLATAMTTKEERREAEKLQDGLVSTRAFFLAGVIDIKKGEITSLALPTMTQAYKHALKRTTIAERARGLKRMLDTNNRKRPAGSTNAVFRDMPNHDVNLVKVLVTGDFAQVPISDINAKAKEFTIAACLPHLQELINRLTEEQVDEGFDESMGHDGAVEAGSKRKFIAVSVDNLSYDSLKSMFANFESLAQTMFVCDTPGIKPIAVVFAGEVLSFLLREDTKRWFTSKNTAESQVYFIFFVLQRFDEFLCKMAAAGEDYQNHEAIAADNVAGIDKENFSDAVEAMAETMKELKKLVSRGQRVKEAPDFLSTQPPKKLTDRSPTSHSALGSQGLFAKGSGSGKPSAPPIAPAPSNARGWNAGSGWGKVDSASAWSKKREFSAEESKKRGDLFVKDGFDRPLANGLHRVYCAPFLVKGQYCGDPNCSLKHRPIERWPEADKIKQLGHVESNRDKILFNVATVKTLPPEKKHLLGDENGPVSGERR